MTRLPSTSVAFSFSRTIQITCSYVAGPAAVGGRSESFLDDRAIVREPTTLPCLHRGYVALVGLTLVALLLAAPGPDAVPAARAGTPRWLLGIGGRGLDIEPRAYLGL